MLRNRRSTREGHRYGARAAENRSVRGTSFEPELEISDAYERGLLGDERWYAAASRRVELDEVEAFERGELLTAPSCYGR